MTLASFCSDAGHEAATAILPLFLISIGAPAAALGAIEGVADAVSSFVKPGAGGHALLPYLDRDFWMGNHVSIPIRLFAKARSHYISPCLYVVVYHFQHRLARLTRFTPDVVEQHEALAQKIA